MPGELSGQSTRESWLDELDDVDRRAWEMLHEGSMMLARAAGYVAARHRGEAVDEFMQASHRLGDASDAIFKRHLDRKFGDG